MAAESPASSVSKPALWIGWILGVLPALLLIFSGVMKLVKTPEVVQGFEHLGWSADLALALAIVELASTLLYLIPQTAVLGAVLLTGYMGGAIATHLRISEPFIVQSLIPIALWLGLYLRDPRLRKLLPLRNC